MEWLERIGSLARAQELDRQPGYRTDRQRRATTGVAVDLGQDQAGDRRRLGECLGDRYRLLPDHGVDHEQRLRWTERLGQATDLVHQRLIDGRPAGGVDDHDVAPRLLGRGDASLRDLQHRRARRRAMDRDVELLAQRLELVCRGGTVRIRRNEHRPAALLGDVARELGRARRLARALQADEHDHDRRRPGEAEGAVAGAEDRGQLLVDDLDDLLAGVEALQHVSANRPLADARHEVLDDLVVDVGLEQGEANLAHRGIDVGLGDAAAAGQAAEDVA